MKGLNKQFCGNRMQLDRLATECHEHARKKESCDDCNICRGCDTLHISPVAVTHVHSEGVRTSLHEYAMSSACASCFVRQ